MIDSLNSQIEKEAMVLFKKKQDELLIDDEMNIVVSHFGLFSQDLINSLSIGVEDLMTSSGDKKHIIKRVFSILIEGLQNIRIHGGQDEHNRQLGYLMIAKDKQMYKILMANLVTSKDMESVREYIHKINSFSERELRNLYLEVLSMGYLSHKGGAGLGFITMKLKSGKPLEIDVYPVGDDLHLFNVGVAIDR